MSEARQSVPAEPPGRGDSAGREAHLKRLLLAIRNVNQLILREPDPQRLVDGSCACLTQTLGYATAWMAVLDAPAGMDYLEFARSTEGSAAATSMAPVTYVAVSSNEGGADSIRLQLQQGHLPPCAVRALTADGIVHVADPAVECAGCPLAPEYGGRSALLQRMELGGRVYGVLGVSVPNQFAADPEEEGLLREVAGDLAFALGAIEVAEERRLLEREREHLLRSMINAFVTFESVFDAEGRFVSYRFVYINEAYERITGVRLEDVKGKTVQEVWPGTEPSWIETYGSVAVTGVSRTFEMFHQPTDKLYHCTVYRPWPTPERFCVVFEDVTERERNEEALRVSEKRYRDTLDGMLEGCQILSPDFTYLYVNQAAAEHGRITIEQLTGRRMTEVYPGIESTALFEAMTRCMREQIPLSMENDFVYPDGSHGWFELRMEPVPQGLFVLSLDIGERKRVEEALRAGAEEYRLLAETTPDIIWRTDVDVRFTYMSSAVRSVLGYTPEEMIGRPLSDFCSPRQYRVLIDFVRAALLDPAEESGTVFETELLHRDGRPIPLEIHGIVRRDERGEIIGYQGISRDISQRKAAEEELSQLRRSQRMEAVGRLAGGVAHDFNNMLSVIMGHAEIAMAETDPADVVYQDLQGIKDAAERSAALTRHLLAFARRQTVAPQVLDLNQTLARLLPMLQRLIGENIELVLLSGEETWPVRIDPAQIDQVATNLCVNARDAIGGVGRIRIETANVVLDATHSASHLDVAAGEYVQLIVTDDGAGMDRETLEHVFEPFYTTKEWGRGSGLGLATVYGIVRQNGGFITVYSEPGLGTTFKISLPRHSAPPEPGPREVPTQPAARGRETVLLVEDEPAVLTVATSMLRKLGYRVLTASRPRVALQLAEEHGGDIGLLITDVVMPEMNGRELAEKILALHPETRCLFTSGYTADVIAHQGVLEEGVNFIHKPFGAGDLAAKVRRILDGSAGNPG